MQLPAGLRGAIDAETSDVPRQELARAVAELTDAYRYLSEGTPAIRSKARLSAYLQVRMPATFAAARRTFLEVSTLVPDWRPRSMLDLGAGPGTAMWAAAEVFPSLERFVLIEREAAIVQAGKRLAQSSEAPAIRHSIWKCEELVGAGEHGADLVVISYALGELPMQQRGAVVASAWTHTREIFVLVGPGTPHDFQSILAVRQQLLSLGAHILAPCPHEAECPMAGTEDWCHFSQRLERSSEHRRLKAGELGYEDEKFSYVVAARTSQTRATARILRHPLKRGGHVQLRLCTTTGLKQITVSKSQKTLYREARSSEWGDGWEGKSD